MKGDPSCCEAVSAALSARGSLDVPGLETLYRLSGREESVHANRLALAVAERNP